MNTTTTSADLITVSTIAPASVPAGFVAIVASTKQPSNGPTLKAHERRRVILIRELLLDGLPSKFVEFARAALHETAKEQLATLWKAQGPDLLTVHPALFTVDGLLAFASREVESKRLTGERVREAIRAFMEATLPAARHQQAADILASFAGPNKLGNEKQISSLAAKIAEYLDSSAAAADEGSSVLELLAPKLAAREAELRAQRLAYETEAGF